MIKAERLGVILKPEPGYSKFNAGMIREGNIVHMVYRLAKGRPVDSPKPGFKFHEYDIDFISYAKLDLEGNVIFDADKDGIIIPEPLNGREIYAQDPRIVPFEGEYIIFFSYWDEVICRVGMAKTKDFKDIEMIGVIPTTVWDKDAFILPERVNGKIVYIHRIEPNIQIDYFDSLTDMLNPKVWENYTEKEKVIIQGEYDWENKKVGGSIPPIKTELGWLFVYHGVADDRVPFCYRAGVAVLDADNPSSVVARLPYPILEPEEAYECEGDVNNVVFPQGMYLHDGYLYMSYGGADHVVALCRYKYDELMDELKKHMSIS